MTLTVTDNRGASSSTSVTLTVAANQAPVASISPASQTVAKGTVVNLSAAGSTDSDGSIASYLWSTGATTANIAVTVNETQTVSVTVTDNQGATAKASVTLTVPGTNYSHNFSQLYFRGTPNSWGKTAMTLVADNTWQTSVAFTGAGDSSGAQRFKFDTVGDWSTNYGDSNKDGLLDKSGSDIYTTTVATCLVTVNDATLTYKLACPAAPVVTLTPSSSSIRPGSSVTFTAAATDSDGTVQSYLWDTGETGSTLTRTFNTAGTYTVKVTVTDNSGLSSSATATVVVKASFDQTFSQLYFRGTPNSWGSTAMTLVADHTWQTVVNFTGNGDSNGKQRFKFDLKGDWTTNYGDSNADGTANLSGSDIYTTAVGSYLVTFNDSTLVYSVKAQ